MGATVISSGSYVPSNIVHTESLLQSVDIDRWDIETTALNDRLGIKTVSHSKPGTMPSTLAAEAAEDALKKSSLDKSDIDVLIYCGIEGDVTEPATAHIIQSKLGTSAGICFDLKNACHGFTSGIQMANALIMSGQAENVLICSAEISSWKVVQPIQEKLKSGNLSKQEVLNTMGAFTLGDAGGAMIFQKASSDKGVGAMSGITNSAQHELCHWYDKEGEFHFQMNMRMICGQILHLVRKLKKQQEWPEFDSVITHQAGKKPFFKTLEILEKSPEDSISTYPTFGNLASATIPVNFDLMAQKEDMSGKSVMIASAGSGLIASLIHISL